ncbi:MAG TPA: type III-B CRISPR module-associated Cmr3 family protein, partial [Aggregatilineales bacterium]|nr:type III-B CRISPR module-associated Cmr3 family protein [Aggregatilineales bacterium]
MSDQWVFIEAQDVWMFRDSKPFTAQQSFNARSQFPPNPQTMQGVIRSYYLESQGVDWTAYAQGTEKASLYKAVGSAGTKNGNYAPSMGDLQIQGPFIAKKDDAGNVELFVHAPFDLVYHAENKDY